MDNIQEAKAQFIEGYNLFRDRASQSFLPQPVLSVDPSKASYKSFLASSGMYTTLPENPIGVSTHVTTRIKPSSFIVSVDIYCNDLPHLVKDGSFFHEGAEVAYTAAREYGHLQYSRNAGEFVGNWAEAEKTGRLAACCLYADFGVSRTLTTTSSIDELIYSILNQQEKEAISSLACNNARTQALISSMEKEAISSLACVRFDGSMRRLRDQIRQIIPGIKSSDPYLQANDLILRFFVRKEDPSLMKPFLKFLAEENYHPELSIQKIFESFKSGYHHPEV